MYTNVLELLQKKGVTPKKAASTKGGEYWSPCPSCGGKDRFHVWPEQNNGRGSWWCRGCGLGGDIIQFLIEFDGMTYPQACDELGLETRKRPPAVSAPPVPPVKKIEWQPKQCGPPEPEWQAKALKFVDWAHAHLLKNPKQLEYLAGRGITPDTARRFRLGWNPGEKGKDIFRDRKAWGLPDERKKNGKPKRLWVPRGLVIPFFRDDELYRVRIRRPKDMREFGGKYVVLPGSSFAVMLLRPDARAFVVVEAELDAILLDQEAGDLAGAVAMGALEMKPDADACAILRQSLSVLNALDISADETMAGPRSRAWWQNHFDQAERCPVPEGKDPGEAYQAGVDLRAWVYGLLPPILTVGPSISGQKKKGAEPPQKGPEPPVEKVKSTQEVSDVMRDVRKLQKILAEYDVKITPFESKPFAVPDKFEQIDGHKRIMTVIRQLTFRNDGVFKYLHNHPKKIRTAENLIYK